MSDRATDWQSEKGFPETNLHMLESQLLTDVTFLVGEQREIIRAHKFILVSRSCVFETMFCGPLAETNSVEIPDIDGEVFKEFLRYIYTDDIIFDAGTVLSLVYVAKKYAVLALEKQCLDFCRSALSPSNACTFLQQASFFDEEDLKARSLDMIKSNVKECLSSEGFSDLNQKCFNLILQEDGLRVDEVEVFRAAMTWAAEECRRQGKEVTPATKRAVLGRSLYLIRYPLIPEYHLADIVYPEGILTNDEIVPLFVHYSKPDMPLDQFVCTRRKSKIYHLSRSLLKRNVNSATDRRDGLFVSCNRSVSMIAIFVYGGDIDSTFNMTVEVCVKDNTEKVISDVYEEIRRSENESECRIPLPTPVNITRDSEFNVKVVCNGPERWLCNMNNKSEMTEEESGVTWRLRHSKESQSSSSLNYGHITGFDYSLVQS